MLQYALLALVVCSVGATIATPFWVLERFVQSSYITYFLSCAVVFLFVENWTLVGDLNQKLEPLRSLDAIEKKHFMIIGELSVQNSELQKRNRELQRYANESLTILHWRLFAHKAAALSAIKSLPVKQRISRSMSFNGFCKKQSPF